MINTKEGTLLDMTMMKTIINTNKNKNIMKWYDDDYSSGSGSCVGACDGNQDACSLSQCNE